MQFRPGKSATPFADCIKDVARCSFLELADTSAIIAGVTVSKVIFDINEPVKESFDGPGVMLTIITVEWLEDEQPSARAGDSAIINNTTYRIKSGYPIRTQDCVMMAELEQCR